MKDKKSSRSDNKKTSRLKYLICLAVLGLIVITAFGFIFVEQNKPDPASEAFIREVAAKQLNKDPNELTDEDFADINGVWLSGTELSDIKLIEKFINLQEILFTDIQYPESKIPGWMKLLAKYDILDLKKRFYIDLSPLEKLSNLQKLIIVDAPINNLEPLSKLKKMKQITIANTEISNLEPLKEINSLEKLYIENCRNITDQQVEDLQKAMPDLKIDRDP